MVVRTQIEDSVLAMKLERERPNTSVEPTARAVSVSIVMDSSFTFTVSSARLTRLWLTLIR